MPLDTLTPAQRNQSLAAIIGTAFGVGVAVGAIVPLVSLSLERDGYNALMIGINSAMLPIAVILMGPLMPRIIARLGTLRSVYFGLGITALCVLLFPAIPNYYAWCAIRFVIGLAGAIHWITSETWINLMATSRSRSRVMGIYASVMAAGFVLGPLIINLTGIDGWIPFAAVSAALVVALLPVAFARQVAPTVSGHGAGGVGRAFAAAPTVM
ncbi:MAG: MFS transporter, partial [Dongiaceae bacterium]